MATYQPGLKLGTLVAAADLSTKLYHCVKVDNAGKIALGAGPTDRVIGVLENNPNINQAAAVITHGVAKVVAQAAIAAGAEVACHTDGRVRTAVATEVVVGIALTAVGAANEVVEVLLGSNDIKA